MILSFRTDMPGQTVKIQISLIRVYTICHSVCIVLTHYSMVEPHNQILEWLRQIFWVSEYLGNLQYSHPHPDLKQIDKIKKTLGWKKFEATGLMLKTDFKLLLKIANHLFVMKSVIKQSFFFVHMIVSVSSLVLLWIPLQWIAQK